MISLVMTFHAKNAKKVYRAPLVTKSTQVTVDTR